MNTRDDKSLCGRADFRRDGRNPFFCIAHIKPPPAVSCGRREETIYNFSLRKVRDEADDLRRVITLARIVRIMIWAMVVVPVPLHPESG